MARFLLIVESPAKAKTIAGYLEGTPDQWEVMATGGHIEDLPRHEYGVDLKKGHYQGRWRVKGKKDKVIARIRQAAKGAAGVYVASDNDREGERIARDIIEHAKLTNPLRITFTEITRQAIIEAIQHGIREVQPATVDSQEARRLIDRVVGYPMSGIIRWWFREHDRPQLPNGIGRVLSPALNILSETERAIAEFTPEQYEQIAVDYSYKGQQFRLVNKIKYTSDRYDECEATLHQFRTASHVVENYKRQNTEVSPYPPLVTARMLRAAFYLFGFEPDKTMELAQQLYEGIETPWGRTGLISYPRTDSYNISDEAIASIIETLNAYYGDESFEYVQQDKRNFANNKHAQAAHEAIRPTHFDERFWPRNISSSLTEDQAKLYSMIFYRTLATQMKPAIYDTSILEVDVGGNKLVGRAHECLFDGWERLDGDRIKIAERNDDPQAYKYRTVVLPEFDIGDVLVPMDVMTIQNHTRTPPRYGVGRFITVLENRGIARPSTLDTVVPTLRRKGYIRTTRGMIHVNTLGQQIDDWTTVHAHWLNNPDEARRFEEQLDAVEKGSASRDELIDDYARKVAEVKRQLGYRDPHERPPSEAQISLANKIATETGAELTETDLISTASLSKFIRRHQKNHQEVGRCPVCKEGRVIAWETQYKCNRKECDFRVWRKSVEWFMGHFKPDYAGPDALMTDLLRRKKTALYGLQGKEGRQFDAYYEFRPLEKGNAYGIQHAGWVRKKKTPKIQHGSAMNDQ